MADIVAHRVIEDVSTLRALADPLRMKLVELAMAEPGRTWTARELADRVGVQATNIYYHLNMLERHELLAVRETRLVNGIVEKQYGAGQMDLTFHRRTEECADVQREATRLLFIESADELDAQLASGKASSDRDSPEPQRMMVSRRIASIPEERISEFREELLSLANRFESSRDANGHRFTMLIAMYPSQ